MAVGNMAVELLKWLLKYHPSVSLYLFVDDDDEVMLNVLRYQLTY